MGHLIISLNFTLKIGKTALEIGIWLPRKNGKGSRILIFTFSFSKNLSMK